MKISKRMIAVLLVAVMIASVLPISASAAEVHHYAGNDDHRTLLAWGTNGDSAIMVINNDHADGKVVTFHYKNGKFYADEDCRYLAMAIGYENRRDTWACAISWEPLYTANTGDPSAAVDSQCSTITGIIKKINAAYSTTASHGGCWDGKSDRVALGIPTRNELTLRFVMHETYTATEEDATVNYFAAYPATGISWAKTHTMFNQDNNQFVGRVEIVRADDPTFTAPLLSVGKTVDHPYSLHFDIAETVKIDNNTTDPHAVAVEVKNALFQFEDGQIINSKAVDKNYGIGVQLTDTNSRIELGYESAPYGSGKISGCAIGIDVVKGNVGLKPSNPENPYSLKENDIAVNLHKGSTVGVWCDDISMLDPKETIITLAKPTGDEESWQSGDIVITSGASVAGGMHNTFVEENDFNHIEVTDGNSNVLTVYALEYSTYVDDDGQTKPCFRLKLDSVFSTSRGRWYSNLFAAVNDTTNVMPAGDTLVIFDATNETRKVTINKNITIRGSVSTDAYDTRIGTDVVKTVSWYDVGSEQTLLEIVDGGSVTLGGNVQYLSKGTSKLLTVASGGTADVAGAAFAYDTTTVTTGTFDAVENGGTLKITSPFTVSAAGGVVPMVYLRTNKVITKNAADVSGSHFNVRMETIQKGKDILVSNADPAIVSAADRNLITLYKTDGSATSNADFFTAYNDAGRDTAETPLNVVEVDAAQITITYDRTAAWKEAHPTEDRTTELNAFYGDPTPAVSNPEWEDYTFMGWNNPIAEIVTGTVTYTAVWNENVSVFYIVHYSDGGTAAERTAKQETVHITDEIDENGFDITTRVRSGYLYGGLAVDADFAVGIESSEFVYGNGLALSPGEDDVYYLYEIPNAFLQPKIMTITYSRTAPRENNNVTHYLLSAIDSNGIENGFVSGYGFSLNNNFSDYLEDTEAASFTGACTPESNYQENPEDTAAQPSVYKTIQLYEKGEVSATLRPGDIFGSASSGVVNNDSAYLTCCPVEMNSLYTSLINNEKKYITMNKQTGDVLSFQFTPYLVTNDGVLVTGTTTRKVTNDLAVKYNGVSIEDVTHVSYTTNADISEYTRNLPGMTSVPVSVCSTYAMTPNLSNEKIEVVDVNVVADDTETVRTLVAGDCTDDIKAPVVSGKRFVGWYTDEELKNPADLSNVSADMTIYAKYISNRYYSVAYIAYFNKNRLAGVRLISAKDMTEYKEFGFEVQVDGGEVVTYPQSAEYATVSGERAKGVFGSGVNTNAKLFYQNISTVGFADGTEILVKPYFVTCNGEKMYGNACTIVCNRSGASFKR